MHPLSRAFPVVIVVAASAFHGTAEAINGAQPGGNGIKNAAMVRLNYDIGLLEFILD